jgi:tetratricopeptide (TPR) repeat protein
MVGKFIGRDFAAGLRKKIHYTHATFEMAIRPLETEHNQESNIAGPSEVLQPLAKQTSSLVNLEKRVPTSSKGATVASTVIMYGGTAPSPGRAIETAEIYEGSDEWGMDNPEDWAAILLEMRNNVQDLAVSLLGQDQLSSRVSNPSGSKGVNSSGSDNLALELRRMENHMLMQITSFTPLDPFSPHDQFQTVKLTPSHPIVFSGRSWDGTMGRVIDLFYSVNISGTDMRTPQAASTLFDLSQTLEDLCMHHYSHTVTTWALQIRRGLYHSDKDMHRRNLASILSLRARVLGRLGKTDDAMIAARRAVQLCYEDQVLQGVQLARALHIQASSLKAAGKRSEAKAVAMEMVEILAALGDEKPHLRLFLSLARASLSDILVDMEEYTDALATAQAAIKSARALIGVLDSRPALAIALLVKARALSAQGERGSAYVACLQAVRYLRDMTSERPGFTTFLAHAIVLSSRHLQGAGFYWEARKLANEAVELYRTLHTSAPRAYAQHYAEALGHLVQMRTDDTNAEAEVFDMAQHAAGLFREAEVTDSDALAAVLVVIASHLLEAQRLQDAAAPAEEAVGIRRRQWVQNPEQHAAEFVTALRLASACFPDNEEGLEYAKEAVQVHRECKDLDREAHQDLLAYMLMDVFSRLMKLGREVEAIPWKTEAAKLNIDLVESNELPPPHSKDTPDGIMGSDSDDDQEDI